MRYIISIIDFGMGNIGSIQNMLARIGVQSDITSDHAAIRKATKLILPGVGAFDKAMTNLRELGLIDVLNEMVLGKRVPVLGICLGMQLLGKSSAEGVLPGLGWIDAETLRFRFEGENSTLRVPHMGWNHIRVTQPNLLTQDLPEEPRFYFVHSYYVRCNNSENVLAETTYGFPFHSAVIRGNIMGTQFHPEKSHKYGMKLLRNFAEAGV